MLGFVTMELKEPKRKRRVRISLQQPFPIATNRDLWQVYTGRYSGDFVVVDAPDEMAALHNMGFFGKGSLSRGGPEFGKEKQGTPPFVRERQWKRRCKWAEQQEEMVKQFSKAQKKSHKTQEDTASKPTSSEADKVSAEENKQADSCNEEKKESDVRVEPVNDKVEKMDVDVTAVDRSKECCNVDDVITLDSAEEDNGNKMEGKDNEKSEKQNIDERSEKKVSERKESADTEDIEKQPCRSDMSKRMVLVLPDSDDDDEQYLTNINPRLEKDPFPVHESLHLTLEESFFLSYGLGCLQVIDMFGNCLSIDGMWQLFCKSQKDFIQKYVAYHYFRSKGWVVKPGIKFGADFLLYKQGPPFYHASYMIVLEVVDSATLKRHPAVQRTLTWTRLMGLNRVAESAGKEVMLCQIMWPSDAGPTSLESPSVLSKFKVHEVLVRRWVSSQEREENDTP